MSDLNPGAAPAPAATSVANQKTAPAGSLNPPLDLFRQFVSEIDAVAGSGARAMALKALGKPGIKTSEFWLLALALVAANYLAYRGVIHGNAVAILDIVSPFGWQFLRNQFNGGRNGQLIAMAQSESEKLRSGVALQAAVREVMPGIIDEMLAAMPAAPVSPEPAPAPEHAPAPVPSNVIPFESISPK